MKYLILLSLLAGCGESSEVKIKRQAAEFCSCHRGLDLFYYVKDDFIGFLEVQCKDGTRVESKGKTDEIELGGGDNCQD